ncbi:hypothetical protein [Sphingomicrobium sediminis]|uniref:Uncharacterized protein n=1 Tax=Sphingomicrobium sediminis TaxID=2950949 RepID=A0A9X2J4Z4_9SPHN|nr:hypothetical protein [Sphingomicrobium sediminis]MCM8557712.1 hypothetical protein [Sphingomicrobium sediminis]
MIYGIGLAGLFFTGGLLALIGMIALRTDHKGCVGYGALALGLALLVVGMQFLDQQTATP